MGSQYGYEIYNPANNNVDLQIFSVGPEPKLLKRLEPGHRWKCERREIRVIEVKRPVMLELTDQGELVPDKRRKNLEYKRLTPQPVNTTEPPPNPKAKRGPVGLWP